MEHGRMLNSQSRGPGFEFLVDISFRSLPKYIYIVVARICCVAGMLPREAELVSGKTGRSGQEKCNAVSSV